MTVRTVAPKEFVKRDTAVRKWQVDCTPILTTPGGATTISSVTGSPEISPITASPLVISGAAPTSIATVDNDGFSVAAGKAIEFTASGGLAGQRYLVVINFAMPNGESDEAPFYVNVEG